MWLFKCTNSAPLLELREQYFFDVGWSGSYFRDGISFLHDSNSLRSNGLHKVLLMFLLNGQGSSHFDMTVFLRKNVFSLRISVWQ